jgi:hypothetical protein
LTWAALTLSLLTAWKWAMGDPDLFTPVWFAVNAVVWTAAGLGFGWSQWHLAERAYLNWLRSKP